MSESVFCNFPKNTESPQSPFPGLFSCLIKPRIHICNLLLKKIILIVFAPHDKICLCRGFSIANNFNSVGFQNSFGGPNANCHQAQSRLISDILLYSPAYFKVGQ